MPIQFSMLQKTQNEQSQQLSEQSINSSKQITNSGREYDPIPIAEIKPPQGPYGTSFKFSQDTQNVQAQQNVCSLVVIDENNNINASDIAAISQTKQNVSYAQNISRNNVHQDVLPKLSPQVIQQYQHMSVVIHQLIYQAEQQQLSVLNNLASMDWKKIQILQHIYQEVNRVSLFDDISCIVNESLCQALTDMVTDPLVLLFQKFKVAIQQQNLVQLVNTMFTVNEEMLLQVFSNYKLMYGYNPLEMYNVSSHAQNLVQLFCSSLVKGSLNSFMQEEYIARYLVSSLQQNRLEDFIQMIATIHRSLYFKVALKVETHTLKTLSQWIKEYFSGDDQYIIVLFNEYRIDIAMGVALVLNNLIHKQAGQREIIQLAAISGVKQIQICYQKYGNLNKQLQGQILPQIAWRVAMQ
ncbi:Conserved_hypothetical protein [Hexamita inflata]|uniref:Uncharacterized protein n=1 Tax=Hexamita inflata TaxID=28002 RepID=A0AA86RE38_9EUKA|nr:Conserved hypothetical protein [Hexamita inflata]